MQGRGRDRLGPMGAGGELGERRHASRHGHPEGARVEHVGLRALFPADAAAGPLRRRPVVQRVGCLATGRDVGQEVDEQPADRAVGPALEDTRLRERGAAPRRRDPDVRVAQPPARQRHAGGRGPRLAGNARRLFEGERHGEPRRAGVRGTRHRERQQRPRERPCAPLRLPSDGRELVTSG